MTAPRSLAPLQPVTMVCPGAVVSVIVRGAVTGRPSTTRLGSVLTEKPLV